MATTTIISSSPPSLSTQGSSTNAASSKSEIAFDLEKKIDSLTAGPLPYFDYLFKLLD